MGDASLLLAPGPLLVQDDQTSESMESVHVGPSIYKDCAASSQTESLSSSEGTPELSIVAESQSPMDVQGLEISEYLSSSIECSMKIEANPEESHSAENKYEVREDVERQDEALTGSTLPCIDNGTSLENNSIEVQPPVFQTENENKDFTNDIGGDLEALHSQISTMDIEVHKNFVSEVDRSFDISKEESVDQVSVITSFISSDIEGWQRFDADEVNINVDPPHGTELWEQLLDDGLETNGKDVHTSSSQLAVAPSPYEENYYGLASPGNPFIEEQERMSSFSEADGFVYNRDFPSSGRMTHNFEDSKDPFLNVEEGTVDIDSCTEDSLPGVPQGTTTFDGEKEANQQESVNEHGSRRHVQPSHLSFSGIPMSSFDSMEPFEAPSFMSLVDPGSSALFKASMPTYQVGSTQNGQEDCGEKWVANFELMAPSTQEITRSSSLPRVRAEAVGKGQGQSFSFSTSEEHDPRKKESPPTRSKSSFSPKFSPLVQKVMDKVRTTPAVAHGVVNTVRQVMSPKATDSKATSKSTWLRCICC